MPKWLRITLFVVLIPVAVVVLFTWVFPWVERTFEQDPTVPDGTGIVVLVGPEQLDGP